MVHFNKIFLMVVFISAYANSGGGGIPVCPPLCMQPCLCMVRTCVSSCPPLDFWKVNTSYTPSPPLIHFGNSQYAPMATFSVYSTDHHHHHSSSPFSPPPSLPCLSMCCPWRSRCCGGVTGWGWVSCPAWVSGQDCIHFCSTSDRTLPRSHWQHSTVSLWTSPSLPTLWSE